MEKETAFINDLLLSMQLYQCENDIKGCCIQNCQYFYDMVRFNCSSIQVKPKAAIVVYQTTIDSEEGVAFHIHMVLEDQDGEILDPSYEIHSLQSKMYFTSVKDFTDFYKKKREQTPSHVATLKSTISQYLNFLEFEKSILDPRASVQSNEEIYNAQAAYVRALLKTRKKP